MDSRFQKQPKRDIGSVVGTILLACIGVSIVMLTVKLGMVLFT